MNAYPITYDADYLQHQSRATTFFRMIVAIPILIFLAVYGFVAYLAVFIAWLALLFTARYPQGLYNFAAGYLRLASRTNAYAYLLVDKYPPFSGGDDPDYPVRIGIGPPQEKYNRLKVFFRFILGIPTMIMMFLFSIWAELLSIGAWFAIVFTGKLPEGIYEQQVLAHRYLTRGSAFFLYLLDRQPPISDKSAADVQQPPASAPPPPPPPPPPAGPAQ